MSDQLMNVIAICVASVSILINAARFGYRMRVRRASSPS